jgi:hypothetical protein
LLILQSTVDTDLSFVGISYIQGLFYKLKMFLGKFGFNVVGKPSNTLFGSIFSKLKYKTPTPLKSTVVYRINCRDCALFYIGNTMQYLKARVGRHKTAVNSGNSDYSVIAVVVIR